MYNRNDPRFRRTLNQISQNLESANESAQVGLFSLNENCLKPCFYSVGSCLRDSTFTCFPRREDRPRRTRGRPRGRPELSFDFYDDWEEDENDALLAFGNEEFDRLLGDQSEGEPSRRGNMNYGSSDTAPNSGAKRKSRVIGSRTQEDPTVIPNTSYFGFLDRLPFHYFGGRGLRYKPSAADLQERPKRRQKSKAGEDLLEEEEEHQEGDESGKSGRQRSGTVGSGHTTDSLSSRGDIFPSDEEDDAVMLDDEFAVALGRRTTGSGPDDNSSGKTRKSKRSSGAKKTSRSNSSRSGGSSDIMSSVSPRRGSSETAEVGEALTKVPTLSELKHEEQRAEVEEEHEVEAKRQAAIKLASERGLQDSEVSSDAGGLREHPEDVMPEVAGHEEVPGSSAAPETNNDTNEEHERIENQQEDGQS
ncbi:MAG: hypothetical protein M1831_006749 [Alyxoria varia]|nr:MAG: hypothetical protein M1831_006749 [Alyxoria varia]